MKDYSNYRKSNRKTLQERGLKKIFEASYKNSVEGFKVTVDGQEIVRAIIQRRTNPLTNYIEDKDFTTLVEESDCVKWGSYIENYKENEKYIIITKPETTDGVNLCAKIRKTTSVVEFSDEHEKYTYGCVETNYELYDGVTYVTDTKVFLDADTIAVVIPYDIHTEKLVITSQIYVNGILYKVLKTEHLKQKLNHQKNTGGIIQLVLIRTATGVLRLNDGKHLEGILRFARMKDKTLNAKSRELITLHNQVQDGDYVTHIFNRETSSSTPVIESKTYLAKTMVEMKLNYDICYLLECVSYFNMLNEKGEVITIPCYVDDNYSRPENMDRTNVRYANSEYRIIVQYNKNTKKIGTSIQRLMIDEKIYNVVGVDSISNRGLMIIGLVSGYINTNTDSLELGIADYIQEDRVEVDSEHEEGTYILSGMDYILLGAKNNYILKGGNTTKDIPCVWNIEQKEEYCCIDNNIGNELTIVSTNNVKYKGKKVTVKCTINDVVYSKEVVIRGWI